MTQENLTAEPQKVQVSYATTNAELSVPVAGNLASLLALQEMKEITVYGKPLLINANQVEAFLKAQDSAINTEEDLATLIEKQLSPEDVEKIFNQQVHSKLIGQQFKVEELEQPVPVDTEELTLLVPQVKLSVEIVEEAIEAIVNDDLTKYVTYLPPKTDEEKLNPVRCLTGNAMREVLNSMQKEEGGLDMNSQILVYAKLLTLMPDDDPTKKYGLFQMRALMQYGDVVSNGNMRKALTELIEEEI